MSKKLREGFTTGTAASAAAAAALQLALTGRAPEQVDVALPPFDDSPRHLTINILRAGYGQGAGFKAASTTTAPPRSGNAFSAAWAEVEKDGGDDPDATRHAHIIATVELLLASDAVADSADGFAGVTTALSSKLDSDPSSSEADSPRIHIDGGTGVGRVTLPGLPVPAGAAAINPVPRQQISHALCRLARSHGYSGGLRVCISVPEGELLARRTLNGRLGIVGGISILGTQGTVKPFSHSAWKATIVQGLNVAQESGCSQICLSTGRRSEKLLMAQYPHLPAQAFIQAADFAKFSLEQAGQRPFFPLVWGCFFGKLLKLSEGHPYTHARSATLDMRVLSGWCHEHNLACAGAIARCVTAGHALECLLDDACGMDLLHHVGQRAAAQAQGFAGRAVRIHLFHIQGQELLVV